MAQSPIAPQDPTPHSLHSWLTPTARPGTWPRPPSALVAARLDEPPGGAQVCVAGLVLVRQRPGSAKGVIFMTLEDETGTCNVVVWASVYERFRRAVIAGRLLRVTGRLQREADVVHVVAATLEGVSVGRAPSPYARIIASPVPLAPWR